MSLYPPRAAEQCPVCLSWCSTPLFIKSRIEHRRCNECSSIYTEPYGKISVENYGKTYQKGYDADSSYVAAKEWAEQILKGAQRIYGSGNAQIRLLEVGCSTGHLLQALADEYQIYINRIEKLPTFVLARGLSLFGIDISEYGIQQCANHGFHNVHVACFPDIGHLIVNGQLRLPFDVVVLTHLLEHVPNVQDAWDVLSLIARVLFIHMPCADLEKGEAWIHFNPRTIGEHCIIYSKFGLRLMLQGHGFEIVDEGTTVDDQWVFAINRRYGLTKELWNGEASFQ